jgi:transporter family-2 protein
LERAGEEQNMTNSAFAIPALFVLVAGAMMGVQAPTNAMLSKVSGSAVLAALISFAIGTVALLAAWLASANRPAPAVFSALPWYAWLGGLYGACFIAAGVYATPRIGLASMITISVAGQVAMALWLDHLGAFGLAREPASPLRVAGVLLVIVGVVLVRRG